MAAPWQWVSLNLYRAHESGNKTIHKSRRQPFRWHLSCKIYSNTGAIWLPKARQSRLIVPHQPLTRFACRQAVIFYYYLLLVHTQQIYSTTAIKSGCVMAWGATMTIEAASLFQMQTVDCTLNYVPCTKLCTTCLIFHLMLLYLKSLDRTQALLLPCTSPLHILIVF